MKFALFIVVVAAAFGIVHCSNLKNADECPTPEGLESLDGGNCIRAVIIAFAIAIMFVIAGVFISK